MSFCFLSCTCRATGACYRRLPPGLDVLTMRVLILHFPRFWCKV